MIFKDKTAFLIGLGFCASTAIGVFGVIRFLEGNYPMVALDAFLSVVLFALSVYVLKTGNLEAVRSSAAIITVLGTLATIYFKPQSGMFWIYVSIAALFYLLNYRQALYFSAALLIGSFVLLFQSQLLVSLLPFGVTIFLILTFSASYSLTVGRMNEKLTQLSLIDDLTKAGNRRAFSQKVKELTNLNKRVPVEACLIYLDIDRFKEINDEYGHTAGDIALIEVANAIQARLRSTDSLFRLGGDEFIIVAEGTDQDNAKSLAEILRDTVSAVQTSKVRRITISLGVSQLQNNDTSDSWTVRTDQALYQAKEDGRNTVSIAVPIERETPTSASHAEEGTV